MEGGGEVRPEASGGGVDPPGRAGDADESIRRLTCRLESLKAVHSSSQSQHQHQSGRNSLIIDGTLRSPRCATEENML
ncbi:unnamed protein product [Musa acuminata subsp. malaccensis]|uniref:(wild Malaysian banana) hypothetical protein n=1 Tax=Musa acuminata subsp. malaccensis TaxID=214687 RepID=A0A804IU84_MUSAM|nr:unnamed protein product [Musa acuminata subsp. malaccensis]